MPTLRETKSSLLFVLFLLKLMTSINDQKFVSIDNNLNEIKILCVEAFATDLAVGPEYAGEREEQRLKGKCLNRRSQLKNKREQGNEARMVMGFLALSRPCVSWLEPGKAVVL